MPNWCNNTLEIKLKSKKEKQSLINFLKDMTTPDGKITFDFNKITPRPKSEEKNWFAWNIQNWGTKWSIPEDEIITVEEKILIGKIILRFNTAWSPPLSVIRAAALKYTGLSFKLKYWESGMGFRGICIAYKDKIENKQYKYGGY